MAAKNHRIISLTQGKVTKVSVEDFNTLSGHKWHAARSTRSGGFYAYTVTHDSHGQRKVVSMQRMILGLCFGDGIRADHIDHDTLNNQRSNLRRSTPAESNSNRRISKRNKSGFKGVSQIVSTGRWRARINQKGKRIHLGVFSTSHEAYSAYCVAAKNLHGEFASLR